MAGGIFVVLGLYGVGIAAVHLAWLFQHRPKDVRVSATKPLRYIFICRNNEQVIEWYVRSFLLYAWLNGEALELFIIDRGSTDHTPRIIERFANRGVVHVIDEQTLRANPAFKQQSVIMELGRQEELGNIPFPS